MLQPLLPEQLRRVYDPSTFKSEDLENNKPLKAIIGQDRAVKALRFGLGNRSFGYNVYIAGNMGEDTVDAVLHFLQELAAQEDPPCDWCYVNNFEDPYFPRKLSMPQGQAREFKTDIQHFIQESQRALVKAFESEEYANKRGEIQQFFQTGEQKLFAELEQRARQDNFFIKRTPVEVVAVPMMGDHPMTDQEFFALTEGERELIIKKQESFKEELKGILRKSRDLEREVNTSLFELNQKIALFAIQPLLDELQEKYQSLPDVLAYLDAVKGNILEKLTEFLGLEGNAKDQNRLALQKRYEVNLLVDNGAVSGAPIVLELNPTYNNLFGKIEKETQMGALVTDFSLIRGGSLHAANGGYIVIPVEELLRDYFSWESLKRALRNRSLVMEDAVERLGFVSTKGLRPEAVPLSVQVILVGNPRWYYLLYELDEEFRDLFKVRADFDVSMEATPENARDFIGYINHYCAKENLLPLDASAFAAALEYGHRLAEHQHWISNQLGPIADLVMEAHHYAFVDGGKAISAAHIWKALEERHYRSGMYREKALQYVREGVVLLEVSGARAGQINGLSVISLGDMAFGRPGRITASVGLGGGGIIDIEREAKLGGPIHTKGVLILSGFLMDTFGRDKAIKLSARLVFEQSYGGVEGDSASSPELYALLSAIAGIPLRQDLAVTGSVNQKGEIQAVGGINEKIEGFFDVCSLQGLTGAQGVLIPASNVINLMLRPDVVEALRAGKFQIYPVSTVAEGLELLSGIPVSEFYEKVNMALNLMAEKASPPPAGQ